MSVTERFWSKVDRSGGPDACWPYLGYISKDGYAHFGIRRDDVVTAHRHALELTLGPLEDDVEACHNCEGRYPAGSIAYRACCNPSHLWPGTHSENMADMVAKGRHVACPGEDHGMAKLTEAAVRDILATCSTRRRQQRKMARKYNVHDATISRIVLRQTWAHVEA